MDTQRTHALLDAATAALAAALASDDEEAGAAALRAMLKLIIAPTTPESAVDRLTPGQMIDMLRIWIAIQRENLPCQPKHSPILN